MNHAHLIRMANQIGTFFDSMPDQAEAMEGLALHIQRFWEPRMRQAFQDVLDGPEADQVLPIVREALQKHQTLKVA